MLCCLNHGPPYKTSNNKRATPTRHDGGWHLFLFFSFFLFFLLGGGQFITWDWIQIHEPFLSGPPTQNSLCFLVWRLHGGIQKSRSRKKNTLTLMVFTLHFATSLYIHTLTHYFWYPTPFSYTCFWGGSLYTSCKQGLHHSNVIRNRKLIWSTWGIVNDMKRSRNLRTHKKNGM